MLSKQLCSLVNLGCTRKVFKVSINTCCTSAKYFLIVIVHKTDLAQAMQCGFIIGCVRHLICLT